MSNNVDRVEIVASEDFRISRKRYEQLVEQYKDEPRHPEGSFLFEGEHKDWLRQQDLQGGPEGFIYVNTLWWSGDFSGHSVPLLLDILKNFEGSADIVLTYESGDDEGYRISEGGVVQHEVIVQLGEPIKAL